jgi:hypothetical protein
MSCHFNLRSLNAPAGFDIATQDLFGYIRRERQTTAAPILACSFLAELR